MTAERAKPPRPPSPAPSTFSAVKIKHPRQNHRANGDAPSESEGEALDFYWTESDQPHMIRRREILKKHPEIQELFGTDSITAYIVVTQVLIQIAVCTIAKDLSWTSYLLAMYWISGTINHSLELVIHEITHNLVFEQIWANKVLAIVAQIPTGFPSATSFKKYHMDHHLFLGVDTLDVDLPTEAERKFFVTPLRKILWIILQPLFYSLRPLVLNPKRITFDDIVSASAQAAFDWFIYTFCSPAALAYLMGGTLIGLGLHPISGHFISEHYMALSGQETYSYYGRLNCITYNVGYHNEHHDFPRIPWTRLPQLRAMAPEYYGALASHDSWLKVLWKFITDDTFGTHSRVKRQRKDY